VLTLSEQNFGPRKFKGGGGGGGGICDVTGDNMGARTAFNRGQISRSAI